MRWLDRLVIELAQMCRDALGSWQRTGQLCALILVLDGAEDSDGGGSRHWGCRCGGGGRSAGGVFVGGGTVPMRVRGRGCGRRAGAAGGLR